MWITGMKPDSGGLLRALAGKRGLILGALALGVLLLLLPRGGGSGNGPSATEPPFTLEAEEERIAKALSRIAGAGQVTVVLTLDTSLQREFARNTEDSRQSGGGDSRVQSKSEVAKDQDEALTVQYAYPRYRGALVIVQGDGSALKLEITQAVSALTGLGADRITVVRGG
jgi:stage III sporulation protein AG